jgi:polyisoprenoid-binding protein YceI
MITNNIFLLGAFVLMTAGIPVQTTYTLSREYTVTIRGSCTIRNWQETIGNVTGNIIAGLNTDGSIDLAMINIKMSVRSIKSDMGAGMDKKTFESLKGAIYPDILFLVNVPVTIAQVKPGSSPGRLTGILSLAGVSRPITMQVRALTFSEGKMQFGGSQTISMTDYGVKPPSALFGTIKASPEITIDFKTIFINK